MGGLEKKIDAMMAAGEYFRVGELLEQALEQARERQNTEEELRVLNELLGYYRSTGQNEKVLETCERALLFLKAEYRQRDENFATTLLNAATAYRAAGQNEKALELYGAAEQIYTEVLAPGDVRYAALYNNAALACWVNNELGQAKNYLSNAVEILEQSGNAGELATALTNLGSIQMKEGKHDLAEIQFQRALDLFEEVDDDPHRAAAQVAMANLHCLRDEYQDAIALYLEALKVTERFFGRNEDYRVTCRNCERAAVAAGEIKLAREMHIRGESV